MGRFEERMSDMKLEDQKDPEKPAPTSPSSQDSGAGAKRKKRKNKKKTGGDLQSETQNNMTIKPMALEEIMKADKDGILKKKWEFWDTQPVPKLDQEVQDVGKIEEDKDKIKEEPYTLPTGFDWDTLDLNNEVELKEVYELLSENYVEDEDNMFRFDYSAGFLQWALQPPGCYRDWHCGVRVNKNKKLVGFISAVPAKIKVYDQMENMVEINFLCVHKKLRSKRVAPVLIREITRRVHLKGIFQAVYTAGVVLPKPIATCRYYHRSLNPKKLVDVQFFTHWQKSDYAAYD